MKHLLLAAALFSALAMSAPAIAQNLDAIKARKEAFKAMGKVTKEPGQMLKSEIPFDLAKVTAALDAYIEASGKLPALFSDDAKTGGETEALPVIWEKKDEFVGRFAKLAEDAKAAKTAITDEFTFQETFPKVVGSCGGCHKIFREAKN
ncbi:MAG: cytochrome c [Hyphomicrobiaceae bacterium]|nr:cytochrome c [Hyphomicrobiaceae bacterium]